jgi:hypothetical protein
MSRLVSPHEFLLKTSFALVSMAFYSILAQAGRMPWPLSFMEGIHIALW